MLRTICQPTCKCHRKLRLMHCRITWRYGFNFNNILPSFWNAGFSNPNFNPVTGFIPSGWSNYHALQTSLTRRFSHGLQLQAAWTWSHTIDNSTADFHSTDLSPAPRTGFLQSGCGKSDLGFVPHPPHHYCCGLFAALLQERQLADEECSWQLGIQPGLHLRVSRILYGSVRLGLQPQR